MNRQPTPSRRARAWVPVLVALAAVSAPAPGHAQDRPRGDRAELEQRVRERFAEMVKRRLGLDDAQERRVAEVVASFQDERRALFRRQGQLRRRMRDLFGEDGAPGAALDDATARSLLAEMAQVREAEARLFRAEQDALLRVLSPVQVVQFHALREAMADRIRQARQRRGGDDRGGQAGPRGGAGHRGGPGSV